MFNLLNSYLSFICRAHVIMRAISVVTAILILGIISLAMLVVLSPSSRLREVSSTDLMTRLTNQSNATSAAPERRNIVFLKAHKCASSTVQNILMRFGFIRNLDFVLPRAGNYLGNPVYFSALAHVPPDLTSPNEKYNVFTHHTRMNYTAVKEIMPEDAAFVTIIRNPADLYESLYNFYHLEKFTNLPFTDIFTNPDSRKNLNKRFLGRIGLNQMAWDLGYPNVTDAPLVDVKQFVRELNRQYHLVMISEYMEASLVLLCKLMNWPLTNVVNLKLNSRPEGSWKVSLKNSERDVLYALNSIDSEIYDFFLDKFRREIISYGVENMKRDVKTLLNLNNDLWMNCVDKFNRNGYARTTNYDLRNQIEKLCVYSIKNELTFTDEIRTIQREKFNTLKRLNKFLDE